MLSVTTLLLLVVIPGALLVVVSLHAAMQLNVNVDAFLSAVVELLRNDHRTRAKKLSHAIDAPVVVVVRRALELRLPRFDPEGHGGDYRKAPEQGVEERAREALAPVVAEQLARFRPSLYGSALVLVAVAAAIALVWREGIGGMSGLGWAALGLGTLAAALNVRRYQHAKRAIARTIATLAPFVERE